MDEYNKNLKLLEELKNFKGGEKEDVPLHFTAIDDMKYIVEKCKGYNLPQPEIFPWAGGNGIQAEWSYDWYIEIDSSRERISMLIVKEKYYDDSIDITVNDIYDAFDLAKTFIRYVVDLKGER